MGRKIGQVPRRVRGIPFAENVMVDKLPASFRPVNFEYDGTTDTWDHVCRFENTALLYRYSDGVKCRVFAATLTKSAHTLLSQLGDKVIHDFDQLTTLFLHQFASSQKQMRST